MPDQVYVIDDDRHVLDSVGVLLRSLRLEAKTFVSGEALLRSIPSLRPGCILTDLRMPGLSGLDLQAELRLRGFDWPVVFMTGRGETRDVVQAMKNGAVEFIEKPFSDERLLAALHAGFVALNKSIDEAASCPLDEVRTALQQDGVFPHYQQKVDLNSGEIVGFEALIRWGCSRKGDNAELIHRAFDDARLGRPLSERMLDCILADAAGWIQREVPFGHVAINVSSTDLEDESFGDDFLRRLETSAIPADVIHVEVTERVSIGPDPEQVHGALTALRKGGIQIALDDFGTGYAALAHLQDLPFDYIKIDRSFVARSKEPSSSSIIKAMIGLSNGLQKGTVAEGVETREQAAFLREQGCLVGQGFLFGQAVPAEAVPKLLVG